MTSNGPTDHQKSLEYWLSRATDPFLPEAERKDFCKNFCEQVNQELEGQIIACRLLSHKIQSPHEQEALNSLELLDLCVKNCGQRFHNEIAKFRFLNEIIKILSPKYLGNQTTSKVKQRSIELLYSWKISLKHLTKIKQAYEMLKEQGIVSQDPVYINEVLETPPPAPKPKLASFEDDEKARVLSELLKSKNPDDLQAANKLIKSMVKAEDQKIEKISKRSTDLSMASNNARLLIEMVGHFDLQSTVDQELDIMKELANSLIKLRSSLFRYAGEAAEGEEEILADILAINDEVGKALDDYRSRVEPELLKSGIDMSRKTSKASNVSKEDSQLQSLLDFDGQVQNSARRNQQLIDQILSTSGTSGNSFFTGEDVLMIGGGGTPINCRRSPVSKATDQTSSTLTDLTDIFGKPSYSKLASSSSGSDSTAVGTGGDSKALPSQTKPKGLLDLDALSEALIQQHLPSGLSSTNKLQQSKKISLRDINVASNSTAFISPCEPSSTAPIAASLISNTEESSLASLSRSYPLPVTPHPTPEISASGSPVANDQLTANLGKKPVPSLGDVFVALEAVRPSSKSSVTLLDRDQLKIVMHYTSNKPRRGVICVVISISSNRDQPLHDVCFGVKVLDIAHHAIKLQVPTSNTLPAHNPILPMSAISQILLLAASNETDHIPFEYNLVYKCNEQQYTINGFVEVDYAF